MLLSLQIYDIIVKEPKAQDLKRMGRRKMNVVGIWKIKAAAQWDAATMSLVEKNVEDILADTSVDDSDKKMLACKFVFKDDGFVYTAMPIPEDMPKEAIDEYIASGEGFLVDGLLGIERKEWKEEDGKVKFNTGTKGEVLGEAIDPWAEITENVDGSIKFFTYTLVKDE